jgi:hypothetical protein|tara:strand:+ start:319 stop:456 length:138 start_codon:yes stop_codon:yes gene_type:complete
MIPNNPKLEDLLIIKKIERKLKKHVFIKSREQNRQKGEGVSACII